MYNYASVGELDRTKQLTTDVTVNIFLLAFCCTNLYKYSYQGEHVLVFSCRTFLNDNIIIIIIFRKSTSFKLFF